MVRAASTARIPFLDQDGRVRGQLELVGQEQNSIAVLETAEAAEFGEERVQLFEDRTYEYKLSGQTPGLGVETSRVVISSRIPGSEANTGRIETRSHSGVLPIRLIDKTARPIATAAVEVRPIKLSYRSEYRWMLDSVAQKATDLLLEIKSPAQVRLEADFLRDPQTIEQRLSFLQALLGSPQFSQAIRQIITHPHRRLRAEEFEETVRRRSARGGAGLRELASRQPRMRLPSSHPLAGYMRGLGISIPSVPAELTKITYRETLDTPENRFVKYSLHSYVDFLTRVQKLMGQRANSVADLRIAREAKRLGGSLSEVLSHDFFKEVSAPTSSLPLGSPVMQRAGGYREVLQAWIKFNLAAALSWAGGEDVYGSGKRNNAALYEYWLFFQLVDVVGKRFILDPPKASSLVKRIQNGFKLNLKSGDELHLTGVHRGPGRVLSFRFSYNKQFDWSASDTEGSWTRPLRPDFSLAFWPSQFTAAEAERQELMVHLHFDAKYRADGLKDLFGGSDFDTKTERLEQQAGRYSRADLFKMHAYKDAIRRSEGAFILYPGAEGIQYEGYHEILPGLGAFAVRPSDSDRGIGMDAVEAYLNLCLEHLTDRASKREALTYYRFKIGNDRAGLNIREPSPEYNPATGTRAMPPTEDQIILSASNSPAELLWIARTNLFALEAGDFSRGWRLREEMVRASHVSLTTAGGAAPGLCRITNPGKPRVCLGKNLTAIGHPSAAADKIYFLYEISPDIGFENFKWDLAKIVKEAPSVATPPTVVPLDIFLRARTP